jgi:hypothetical protein
MDKEDKKRITKAKRIYTTAKTVRVYTNKIEKDESDLFAENQKLADMVKQRDDLEKDIISEIDETLIKSRGQDIEALEDPKITLLKKCQHALITISGLYASDKEDFSEAFKLDEKDLIDEIGAALYE